MPLSRHNVTKRGTQKERARTHHEYLNANHPTVTGREFALAMMLANIQAPDPKAAPTKKVS